MKFILWTLVWFGLDYLEKVLTYGYPYDNYKNKYSDSTIIISGLIHLFLWIYLYNIFIK